jgi:hypothetical protein
MSELVSFSEFGRRQQVSTQAVSKAASRGRFPKALTTDTRGTPRLIADVAAREWQENSSRPTKPARRRSRLPNVPPDWLSVFTLRGQPFVYLTSTDPAHLNVFEWVCEMSPDTARELADRLLKAAAEC